MKHQNAIPYILAAIFLAVIVFSILSCKGENKEPVYVEYFKNGQVLLPDYACPDTLIVIDAIGLNKAMAYVEQDIYWGSDADCDSLIHIYCKPINNNQP